MKLIWRSMLLKENTAHIADFPLFCRSSGVVAFDERLYDG
jgi:hypothetical protein